MNHREPQTRNQFLLFQSRSLGPGHPVLWSLGVPSQSVTYPLRLNIHNTRMTFKPTHKSSAQRWESQEQHKQYDDYKCTGLLMTQVIDLIQVQ